MARWLLCCTISATLAVPVAALAQAGLGYRTVPDALAAAKTKPGAKLTKTADGWTIVTEQGGSVVWSFTPETHPAAPAVVRRTLDVGEDGVPRIEMGVLCQGEKPACDALTKAFYGINERAMRPLRERMKNADEAKK